MRLRFLLARPNARAPRCSIPSETPTERKPHSVLPTGGWRSSEHPSPAADESWPKRDSSAETVNLAQPATAHQRHRGTTV
jgi:hypothetical protein